MATGPRNVSDDGGVAVNLEVRIVERAAQLLVERLLDENEKPEKPDRKPDTKPVVDGDGDLICECGRVFVTAAAMRQHRTKAHKERAGGPR